METQEEVQLSYEQLQEKARQEAEDLYAERFKIWKIKELAELEESQDGKIAELVNKQVTEWMGKQKPPTTDELETLINQEYITIKLKLRTPTGERDILIQELPQAQEKKFYKFVKDHLEHSVSQLAALTQSTMDMSMEKKILAFFNTVEGGFDILAEACSIVINGGSSKEDHVTLLWCQENLTSFRMWNIVKAQAEVNRLRDFFSEVSQSGLRTQMLTNPANSQQWQQRRA